MKISKHSDKAAICNATHAPLKGAACCIAGCICRNSANCRELQIAQRAIAFSSSLPPPLRRSDDRRTFAQQKTVAPRQRRLESSFAAEGRGERCAHCVRSARFVPLPASLRSLRSLSLHKSGAWFLLVEGTKKTERQTRRSEPVAGFNQNTGELQWN